MSERANRGERTMKLKTKLLGGFAALALCAGSANADVISGTGGTAEYAPGTGALAGFDIFRLYAHVLQTGAETTATGFQSVDATVDTTGFSNQNMKFKFTDLDGTDTTNDADVFGKTT